MAIGAFRQSDLYKHISIHFDRMQTKGHNHITIASQGISVKSAYFYYATQLL